ncbi:MAG: hypothetical protein OES84_04035, partial [Kiritimatiellaceae bacterium]|nr:hypothetical protein [Kiritimatiellaceae bacterium]
GDPGSLFHIVSFGPETSQIGISWTSEIGKNYDLLWSEDLINWNVYSTHPGNGSNIDAVLDKEFIAPGGDPDALTKCFLRVLVK